MSVGVLGSGVSLTGDVFGGLSDEPDTLGLISAKLFSLAWLQYSWNTLGQVLSDCLKPLLVSKAPGSMLAIRLDSEWD